MKLRWNTAWKAAGNKIKSVVAIISMSMKETSILIRNLNHTRNHNRPPPI